MGKKRPVWDLNGRLQDIEYMLSRQEERTSIPQSRLASKGIAYLEQQLSGDLAHHDELPQKNYALKFWELLFYNEINLIIKNVALVCCLHTNNTHRETEKDKAFIAVDNS